ncbi:hypothetical protein RRG08_038303 [Elysia crispata]|uniref:Uncharacterized protein n=1 Tax=Elysia crispata TaxID=231223 RepID=A0AAE1AQ78_9GAST|nr:hypothetical protein RRG08_038303 [Elysia crispata]
MRCVETGVALPPRSGKYVKNCTSNDQLDQVRSHINSFPRIPSHYCRQSTNKEFLEKALNITKMYGLYKDWCSESEFTAVKQHKYSEIFNSEFNIGFLAPKKDRCDKCELGRINDTLPPPQATALQIHIGNKVHHTLETTTQKFCEPGHSSIQEEDSVNSVIERHLRHQEVYSPLGLIRKLTTIRNSQTIQLSQFFDHQAKGKKDFMFSRVPFSQVLQLRTTKVPGMVGYKLNHSSEDWTLVSVKVTPSVSGSTRKGPQPKRVIETQIKALPKPTVGTERHKFNASVYA